MKIIFNTLLPKAIVQIPTSKSISNRVLIIKAICQKENIDCNIKIQNLSKSIDTTTLQEMLASKLLIIYANEAGTAFRFMTAFLCLQQPNESKIITGSPRLRERPIAPLVEALKSIGASIEFMDKNGFAPIKISGISTQINNEIQIDANISSQFISALCMIAPSLPNGLVINFNTAISSEPYIKMTLQLMNYFGVDSTFQNNQIKILPQKYIPKTIDIEGDWSSATFFYCALLLIQKGNLFIENLRFGNLQGDKIIATYCDTFFNLKSIEINNGIQITYNTHPTSITEHFNLIDCPDLAIPFIVLCAIQYPNITISGLHTLILKESNRIEALQTELFKVGLILNYTNDILSFSGKLQTNNIIVFETYNDHRIAMALALVSIVHPNITINNPKVVEKSFPNYWQQLQNIGFQFTFE